VAHRGLKDEPEMAYNLPAAWDPGFVLPQNAQDEGIERRAFVTKQMPRGTYDQPAVGTGGYKVPQYVLDEGYGQGTFTTKWQPSGSYSGPKVPHWLNKRPQVVRSKRLPGGGKMVTVQPLDGDDDVIPAAYQDYGTRAAQTIITQISRLPVSRRAAAMKSLMAKIDPSLWSRTDDIWRRYVAQGITPDKAFPLALARAISAGFSAEVVDIALRRRAPQVNSLLGLGCYGLCGVPRGLGLVTIGDQGGTSTSAPTQGAGTSGSRLPPPPPPPVAPDPDTIDLPSNIAFIGGFPFRIDVPIKAWATGTGDNINNRAKPPLYQLEHPDDLLPEQIKFLKSYLTGEVDSGGRKDTMVSYDDETASGGHHEPDAVKWFDKLGISPSTGVRLHNARYLRTAQSPVAWTTHPKTGEKLAMHLILAQLDPLKDWAPNNPLVLKGWLSKQTDPNWWTSIVQTVSQLPLTFAALDPTGITEGGLHIIRDTGEELKKIHDAILDEINKFTCELLNSKEGETAGAAVASYYGAPPQTGVAGVKAAASLCGGAPAPVILPPPVPKRSVLPLALLAGGGVLTALILLQRRKKKT
jgi:hypothetical protein